MNRPIPTQPVPSKKQEQRHPALLPVLAVLAVLGAVAAYMFLEDHYLKPRRDAEAARAIAGIDDPMYVPVDQFMDTMSIRSLDFANPSTLAAVASTRHESLEREPLNLGTPKGKAVRELGIKREVPPYEEQISIWFISDKTPLQIFPDYYYKIIRRGFQIPVSYSSGPSAGVAYPGSNIPQPPAPATRPSDNDIPDTNPAGPNASELPLPLPDMLMPTTAEDGEESPTTQPVASYNLMFSRKLRENQPDNSINPYKIQSEVLIYRLIPVENGTRMVVWLRTPLKDRASKSPEERRIADERREERREERNQNQPTTRPGNNSGNKQQR